MVYNVIQSVDVNVFFFTSLLSSSIKKIPSINEVFAELNKTIADTSVLSLEASATVNDSLEAGVHQINFTQYHEQVRISS